MEERGEEQVRVSYRNPRLVGKRGGESAKSKSAKI